LIAQTAYAELWAIKSKQGLLLGFIKDVLHSDRTIVDNCSSLSMYMTKGHLAVYYLTTHFIDASCPKAYAFESREPMPINGTSWLSTDKKAEGLVVLSNWY
jgi:regulator of sigma D